MTGMIFAASVSLWRTTAVTNATTAVQQSSRFAAPALTDAVPRMVTTPSLIAIAASPMDDRMWDAGSSPTQMVSTTLGETLGSSLWWDRMCSGKYPVAVHRLFDGTHTSGPLFGDPWGASVGVGHCLTGRTRVGRGGASVGEDTGCGRFGGCGARKTVHLLLPCRRCQRFLP